MNGHGNVAFEQAMGVAPHTFNSLMELYEQNYILMRRLIPQLQRMQEVSVSQVSDCVPLYLQIIERHRYTTVLRLSYLFLGGKNADQQRREPDLLIRLYHDARTAEATSAVIHRGLQARGPSRSLQGNWSLNRFLYKWLGFCLHRGHRFLPDPESGRAASADCCSFAVSKDLVVD